MKSALRHIISMVCAFLLVSNLYAQTKETQALKLEMDLNEYELICESCLSLKRRVAEGEKVSKKEAQKILDSFVQKSLHIRSKMKQLTKEQKARYEMINIWFTNGQKPLALDFGHKIEDVDIIYPKDTLKVLHNHTLVCDSSQHKAPGNRSTMFVMGRFALPLSYGITFGLQEDRHNLGGYISFRSNFKYIIPSYSCSSIGYMSNGSLFWGNGNSCRSDHMFTGGILVGITNFLNINIGTGYGFSKMYWQDIDHSWSEVSDISYSGLSTEVGLITTLKSYCAGVGVSTVSFKSSYLEFSFGIRF